MYQFPKIIVSTSIILLLSACQAQNLNGESKKPATNEIFTQDEDINYKSVSPRQTSSLGTRSYDIADLKISFEIPAGYDKYNVFENLGFDGIVLYETDSLAEVSNNAVGDAADFVIYIAIDEDTEQKTLTDIVKEFKEYAEVTGASDKTINGVKYKKIMSKTFGSEIITDYFTIQNNLIYQFHAHTKDQIKLLEKVMQTINFNK